MKRLSFYEIDESSYVTSDITPILEGECLLIDRDTRQGNKENFKNIFKIDLSDIDENSFVRKEELLDLITISGKNDLNRVSLNIFAFPFVTIKSVLVMDEGTILVANDIYSPLSVRRGEDIDNTETF